MPCPEYDGVMGWFFGVSLRCARGFGLERLKLVGQVGVLMLGTNQTGVRVQNERLLLSLLHRHGSLAKRDITQLTGLSAQTVSVIMRQLEGDGLLLRGEPVRGKVGQPSVPMSLNPDGSWFLGLKVGRRNTELVLIDFVGRVRATRSEVFALPQPDEICSFVKRAVAAFEQELGSGMGRIAGLGIAMPFELWEWSEAIGAPAEAMAVWRDTDLRLQLAHLFSFSVYMLNDGTAACGAELAFGEHRHLNDYVYFHIGSFVGGGLVIGQSLYAGRSGNAGALGSMPMQGLNQLIDDASIITLEQRLKKRGCDLHSLWLEGSAWGEYEPEASAWIDMAAQSLARAIACAASIIDFEAAVIDGAIPEPVRKRLVLATVRAVAELDLPGLHLPSILEGSIGQGAKALGAASLPLFDQYLIGTHRLVSRG